MSGVKAYTLSTTVVQQREVVENEVNFKNQKNDIPFIG
jgi:hypothetical protein